MLTLHGKFLHTIKPTNTCAKWNLNLQLACQGEISSIPYKDAGIEKPVVVRCCF